MRHPHVVQFLGLCYLEGSTLPVLVMERMDSSLDELLEGAPGLSLALKRSLLTDAIPLFCKDRRMESMSEATRTAGRRMEANLNCMAVAPS